MRVGGSLSFSDTQKKKEGSFGIICRGVEDGDVVPATCKVCAWLHHSITGQHNDGR